MKKVCILLVHLTHVRYCVIILVYLSVASEQQFDFICRCNGLQRKNLVLVEKTDCGG